MIYLLVYFLLGSLGLNLLYMYQSKEHDKSDLLSGFSLGMILGPITIIIYLYYILTDHLKD